MMIEQQTLTSNYKKREKDRSTKAKETKEKTKVVCGYILKEDYHWSPDFETLCDLLLIAFITRKISPLLYTTQVPWICVSLRIPK